jgi:hypothetical protein
MLLRRTRTSITLLQLGLASCSAPSTGVSTREPVVEEHAGFSLEYAASDQTVAQSLLPMIERGRATAQQFFATTYASTFAVRVFPDRPALTARWRVAWNQPTLQTECWMIAAGWSTELDILSPSVWRTDACGHDATNLTHVSNVVAHELVHVLHAQRNSGYLSLSASTPWMSEGLATFVSGQWASEYASSARATVGAGLIPETFAALWASSANYALAGSVFAYVDQRYGAEMVRRLLTVRTEAELLTTLSTDAPTLLRGWRAWLLAAG